MNDTLKRVLEALDAESAVNQHLATANMAVCTVVRALAEANADNPAFAAAVNMMTELRISKLIESQASDDVIETYKQSVRDLLPPKLRTI
ncbi:hypothetical protein LGM38_20230 [Burkholderia vietnamiensis]|uniref:hypothetical protein n=1 Tax=Burkholderia vietnamiensis TaxID=60552 RepID=UPI001589493F|nr:hypothetical protein [Burkholderia vietnamiensis]MCA8014369.1 hypothetical protein [Burkholderia vietnamiensis]HDR8939618.1 hypothetical protein [Burkholderia vietnamiensis]HDR9262347.1 hypothetical protein [Burkholderia vietnamiensis]